MLLPSLNERHLVDFFESRKALAHFGKRGVPQKRHPFIARHPFNFRSWSAADDHLAYVVGQIQQFRNSAAPTETCAGAFQAADAFDEFDLAPNVRIKA